MFKAWRTVKFCATRFQWPGGVAVPAPSAQKRAIRVCSGVRAPLVSRPRRLTSLKERVYSALDGVGGATFTNRSGLLMAQGVTEGHCGRRTVAKAGGVGAHQKAPVGAL